MFVSVLDHHVVQNNCDFLSLEMINDMHNLFLLLVQIQLATSIINEFNTQTLARILCIVFSNVYFKWELFFAQLCLYKKYRGMCYQCCYFCDGDKKINLVQLRLLSQGKL